jgi:hypothetical protein
LSFHIPLWLSIYIRVSISYDLVGKTNQTLLLEEDLCPVLLRARNRWRTGASGTDTIRELCSGCTTIWFLGSVRATAYDDDSRLSAMITHLHCYDDDMVDPTSSSNATGYLFLSLLFIYALFFLPLLQSSFLYACLKHILSIVINYIYIIMFKPSFF